MCKLVKVFYKKGARKDMFHSFTRCKKTARMYELRQVELTKLVGNARRNRKWGRRHPCAEAWRAYLEALSAKGDAILKA